MAYPTFYVISEDVKEYDRACLSIHNAANSGKDVVVRNLTIENLTHIVGAFTPGGTEALARISSQVDGDPVEVAAHVTANSLPSGVTVRTGAIVDPSSIVRQQISSMPLNTAASAALINLPTSANGPAAPNMDPGSWYRSSKSATVAGILLAPGEGIAIYNVDFGQSYLSKYSINFTVIGGGTFVASAKSAMAATGYSPLSIFNAAGSGVTVRINNVRVDDATEIQVFSTNFCAPRWAVFRTRADFDTDCPYETLTPIAHNSSQSLPFGISVYRGASVYSDNPQYPKAVVASRPGFVTHPAVASPTYLVPMPTSGLQFRKAAGHRGPSTRTGAWLSDATPVWWKLPIKNIRLAPGEGLAVITAGLDTSWYSSTSALVGVTGFSNLGHYKHTMTFTVEDHVATGGGGLLTHPGMTGGMRG